MSEKIALRGFASPALANWRIVSPEAVTVWPKMIWPTSTLSCGRALTASASASAADENFFGPSLP